MRAIIQRVTQASVEVNGNTISKIGKGIVVFLGISTEDSEKDADYICRKVLNCRIFYDDQEKNWTKNVMNKNFEVLLVSQFTLYSFLKGNKPDFHLAMKPDKAKEFYDNIVLKFQNNYKKEMIKEGIFGAYMNVSIFNDGPVTLILDSKKDNKEINEE